MNEHQKLHLESVEKIDSELAPVAQGTASAGFIPRSGLFLAAIQGEGVVLDLDADRYWAVDGPAATIWQGYRAGLSGAEVAERLSAEHGMTRDRARALVPRQHAAWADAGLWVAGPPTAAEDDPLCSKPTGLPAAVSVREKLERIRPSPRRAWHLLRAKRWSARVLRDEGLKSVLKEIGRQDPRRRRESPAAWSAVLGTVKTHWALRSLFSRRNDCLTRSLILARALQLQGLASDLCFGVRKIPFRAHAWVEVNGVSLMDAVEVLRRFTVVARF